MTNGDLLRAVNRQFTIKSQNSLAEALGVSQQYINKTLKEQ
jgi:biotin operon repressor